MYINPSSISSFEQVKEGKDKQVIVNYNMCDSFGIISSIALEGVNADDFEHAFKMSQKTGETVNLLG